MRLASLLLILLSGDGAALGQLRVFESSGNVMLRRSDGVVEALTHTGLDSMPWLACDGTALLFARAAPEDHFRTTIRIMDPRSRRETVLLAGPIVHKGKQVRSLGQSALDVTGQTLYVMANTSVTSGALYAIDLQSMAAKYITDASSFEVIRQGDHTGDLLVYKRKTSVPGTIYYVYWLYSPSGRDLGIAGPDRLDVRPLTRCAGEPSAK